MKNNLYKIIALLLIINYQLSINNCQAQNIPSAVNFQAVARNASNQIVANATIEVRITITQGNGGPVIRTLTFQKTTDAYGQFTLSLSEGDASSSSGPTPFNNIDWSTGDKWLRVEFRPNLVDAFTLISNSQATASFYAFSARTAEELKTTGVNGQVLKHNGTTWVAGTDEGSTFTAPTVQRFTSGSGTYTTPANVKYIVIEMVGGGGAGATTVFGTNANGGAAGAYYKFLITNPTSYSYSVGAGGVSAGAAGGNTTFGANTAGGGSGGPAGLASAVGGVNSGSLGVTIIRVNGGNGGIADSQSGGTGGVSVFSGGGAANGGAGGISGPTNSGAGGSAGNGAGGSGVIVVTEYYQ